MATNITFTDFVTPVPADWLNNVNFVVNQYPFSSTVQYTYPGSGVTQPIQTKFKRDLVSVVDFGADPTGVADSTSAINACMTAVGPGIVYWPAGTYNTTGEHTIPAGQYHVGAGKGATTVYNTSLTSNHFNIPNNFCGMEDMMFSGPANRTGGACINALAVSHTYLRRLQIINYNTGIIIGGVVQYIEQVDMSSETTNTGSGIIVFGGNDQFISGVVIFGTVGRGNFAGLLVNNSGGVWCRDCDFIQCQNGVVLSGAAGNLIEFMFFDNVSCDTSFNNGWTISSVSTGIIRECAFTQCWAASATNSGFLLQGNGTTPISGMTFTNNRILNCGADGMFLQGNVSGVTINGGIVSGNSQTLALTAYGIHLGANVSDVSLTGVRIGPTGQFADTQLAGIHVDGGTTSRLSIVGCNLQTGHTPVVMGGVTGTNNTMSGCTGVVLKGQTSATTDAAGHILVTHGSGVALSTGLVTVQNDSTPIFAQASGTSTTTQYQFKFYTQAGAALANTAVTFNWLLDI